MRINRKGGPGASYFICFIAIYSISYILAALFYSSSFIPKSDGLEYKELYDQIFLRSGVYGVEWVLPCWMYIYKWLGFDYRDFLFFYSLCWLPLIVNLLFITRSNGVYLVIAVFFLSWLFFESSYFLMRQFVGAMLFFYSQIVRRRGERFSFILLAICSHLTIILWIPMLFRCIRDKIIHGRFFFFVYFLSAAIFVFGLLSNGRIYEYIDWASGYFLWSSELARKFKYYNSSSERNLTLSDPVLLMIFISGALLLIFRPSQLVGSVLADTMLAIMLVSGVFCFFFSANPILANRIGFLAYFFALPFFSLSIWKIHPASRLRFT